MASGMSLNSCVEYVGKCFRINLGLVLGEEKVACTVKACFSLLVSFKTLNKNLFIFNSVIFCL